MATSGRNIVIVIFVIVAVILLVGVAGAVMWWSL